MHKPNPISLAAKASGEPEFREVGVGPWTQEHPGEPRPDDPKSPNYDRRYDTTLLDEGDRRNVLDRYRYWTVNAIRDDLDAAGRHGFEVAIEKLDARFQHRFHGAHGECVHRESRAHRWPAQMEPQGLADDRAVPAR